MKIAVHMKYMIFLIPLFTLFATETIAGNSQNRAKIIAKIERLDVKIDRVDQQLKAQQKDVNEAEKKLEQLEVDEAAARQKLAIQLEELSQSIRSLVRISRVSDEALWLTQGVREASLQQNTLMMGRMGLSFVIDAQRAHVSDLENMKAEQSELLLVLEEKRYSLFKKHRQLEKLFKQQVAALKATDAQKAKYLDRARRIKSKKTLNQLPTDIAQAPADQAVKVRRYSGLPVDGHVVRAFGEKNDVGVKSYGITIQATAAEKVNALGNGRVIYSDDFRDFGFVVIVEQPDGTNLLYSGLGKSRLKVGDFVSVGSPVGLMPNKVRPQLYVEVRQKGETIDPIRWLKRRS